MQLPGDFLADGVLPALFYPGSEAAEAGRAGDIVYEEHRVDVTVVVLHHGLTEALLSCCVPQLELVVRGKWKKKVRDLPVGSLNGWHWRGGRNMRKRKLMRRNIQRGKEIMCWNIHHQEHKQTLPWTEIHNESSLRGTKKRNRFVL